MDSYENIIDQAHKAGMDVVEHSFRNDTIKGLYCDGTAAINKNIETTVEKACVAAEELGHHLTSAGNILNPSDVGSRKQEFRARMHAYNNMIGLIGIITAYEHGCRNTYEMADYLNVTEEFLNDALDAYRSKYGVCTTVDNYVIYFIPALIVMKICEN